MRSLVIASVAVALALSPGAMVSAEEEPFAAGSFVPAGALMQPRALHSALLVPDGRVFVVGGEGIDHVAVDDDGNAETIFLLHQTAEAWDPATGTFNQVGSLASCHGWDPAMLLPDGRVLIIGSCVAQVPASGELWDSETGIFSPTGTLAAAPMNGPRTVLPDGRILFVGGMGYEEVPSVAAAGIWDPQTASLTPAGSLETPRQGHTATLLPDGRVLVVGGFGPFGSDTASAELWDPQTATFGPAGRLVNGWRVYHTATLLGDGRVLIVGGSGPDGYLASAEVWDPQTATFNLTGSLAEARGGQDTSHTGTLLPDGRVLIVGGFGIDGTLDSAEVWDPAKGTFGPAGSLAQARADHTSTLLPNGRVLVVGGRGVEDEFFASAELWVPAGDGLGAGGIADSSPAP